MKEQGAEGSHSNKKSQFLFHFLNLGQFLETESID